MIDLNKLLNVKIKLLGQGISLGDASVEQLQELRSKLKQTGAPELLSDTEWSNRRSSIPTRTGRDIAHIPPSSGFVRSTRSPRHEHYRQPVKANESSSQIKVEKDNTFDDEFQLIPELTNILIECLVVFPEVNDIEIRATHSTELSGCKGSHKGRSIIIIFVPDQVWGKWNALKPIIYHELAHFIGKDSADTERIFFERADEKSKEMWRKLKAMDAIDCSTLRK